MNVKKLVLTQNLALLICTGREESVREIERWSGVNKIDSNWGLRFGR